jgi:hypothetical protein
MRANDIVPVAWLTEASPGDPVLDALMILGPVLIAVVAVVGRTTATTVLAGLYVAGFFVYVVYNGIDR